MGAQRPPSESAHDVLAAEAFVVPGADPTLEPVHDVLAAEEFAMPDRDPDLHGDAVDVPEDPTGQATPHDVLAADEFPMPATHAHHEPLPPVARAHRSERWPLPARIVAAGAGLLVALRLIRRR